ncbi:hypothetical protein TanjilG_27571 [Lupinus angustifolius]|uniref:BAT2 N-terminal domain-containing protein n=1 Tax=Lupinus angustifolius TaxID=3871 RepID=A0A4P1R366_LUPAN|nr:PREDICTED: protein MODIFIER OF SNC1 1-like isoform X1 [Lupinus angustifolius]OIW00320.1 hypothetical protein TanjilG_27571 [Lupinus angustifolius]
MTSSMLSGERRWAGASSRRGGMTVLGKVAVPKPINLPSQRLENHGLDPNVEIVPKGTLSWGGRSSSSASNPWGTSLSPNTDGGTSSPSHLSTRPSSGESGTRPSTAGSDRAFDTTSNAWGSNSRPSSASGTLISNQTSLTSLRPRSAETRPGSSQLSRFAEPLIENSGAWSSARTTEKLGVAQPKNDEFSLSSGDFPTLGSDKDKSVLNSDMQGQSSESHAHPVSSSGLSKEIYDTSAVDDVHVNTNVKGGTVDSWRRDYEAHNDDMRPSIETWQRNTHHYPNAGIPPQHFDAWHGPPVNNPQGGVWFRGPPSGPPFGNPVAPGGFPIEPFPYYRPHIPPTGLANPQPVPSPGTGPRGHHKDRDAYRPHIPDAYIRPGVPIRPGFYPGPMGYEGYYGPPMGYCNPNEREVPFMGIAAGPPIYNRYPNQNPPEPGNSQGRSGGYGTAGKPLTSEHVEFSHPPDTAGPYRVLLKQHEPDGKNKPENWEDSVNTGASYVNGRERAKMNDWENEQRSNYRKTEEIDLRVSAHGEEASSRTFENEVSGSSVIKAKSLESSGNMKKFGDISARKLDDAASDMLEVPPKSSALKDASLIHKIEGLNAKARDNSSARNKEEQRNKFHAGSTFVNQVQSEAGAAIFTVRTHATEVTSPTHRKVGASGGQKNLESLSTGENATSRQTAHGMQGKSDHRNKGILTTQDADGWRKKSVVSDCLVSPGPLLEASDVLVGDHIISIETYNRSGSYNKGRHDGESVQARLDSVDDHAQRAKMKELAKQRTKQLQEEEEERIRRQKAKALAKLDELNRRSQTVAGSTQKENATSSEVQNKQDELQPSESEVVAGKSGVVKSAVNSNTYTVCQFNDTSFNKVEKPILSSEPPSVTHKNSGKGTVLIQNLPQDANGADATNALQAYNSIASKQKQMSHKQKQSFSSEKKLSEKVVSTNSTALNFENDKVVDVMPSCNVTNEVGLACGSGLPVNSSAMVEPSVNQKKNRNVKNKHKVEESSSLTAPPLAPKESNLSEISVESDKPKASDFELDQCSLHPASLSKDSNQFSEQHRHLANEESHARMTSQGKSQDSRRKPRSLQTNRPAEKSHGSDVVMWAPVKPQNNTELMDESSEKSNTKAANPAKRDQQVHNLKNKRAEMERYIPKPVAKEMAQQGSTHQVVSSISQATAGQDVERAASGSQSPQIAQHTNSAFGKVGFLVESKNRDGRYNKQGKAHGSWQQRNLTETTNVHDMQNALDHDSNSVSNVQRPTEHHVDHKSETSLVKGQTKHFNDSSDHDGLSNLINHDSAAPVSVPYIKDHAVTGRGRRGPFRGHKGPGVNHDADHNRSTGETEKIEKHVSSSEHIQTDVAASKENRVVGERLTSHWQPKSQASNNQRGDRPIDQNVGSLVIGVKNDPALDSESIWAGRNKESNAYAARPHHDKSVSGKSKEGEAPHFGNQESGRERKSAPAKRPSLSPNQVSSVEQAPTSVDLRHGQYPSSGIGKNGNQNWFGRGHESRGDWKSPAQDNRHHNHQPKNRERPGSNMHSEYQLVGSYVDGKPDHFGRPRDSSYGGPRDSNHGGGRFTERGHTNSRRGAGNFQGRQGGAD